MPIPDIERYGFARLQAMAGQFDIVHRAPSMPRIGARWRAPAALHQQDRPQTRVTPPGQHLPVGGLRSLGTTMLLDHQPGLRRMRDRGHKRTPACHQPALQFGRAPFGMALGDLRRGEEQHRPGAGQVPGRPELRNMGAADQTAVAQGGEQRGCGCSVCDRPGQHSPKTPQQISLEQASPSRWGR